MAELEEEKKNERAQRRRIRNLHQTQEGKKRELSKLTQGQEEKEEQKKKFH